MTTTTARRSRALTATQATGTSEAAVAGSDQSDPEDERGADRAGTSRVERSLGGRGWPWPRCRWRRCGLVDGVDDDVEVAGRDLGPARLERGEDDADRDDRER